LRLDDYRALGGHMAYVRTVEDTIQHGAWHSDGAPTRVRWESPSPGLNPWPLDDPSFSRPRP
jgi:hypothetical protein